MIAIILIGLAAGSASALMFASVASGALISLLLIYFAPLPLMVAALGWRPLSATVGGIVAAIGVGVVFDLPRCVAFAVTIALPAWWLGHLALLGRPANVSRSGNGAAPVSPTLEWYPIGRLLLWIAGFAVLTSMATLLTFGTDAATITDGLRADLLQKLGAGGAASDDEIKQQIDAVVMMAPVAFACSAVIMLAPNLWLAAKITATSGRLHRPWPVLKSTELPPMTLAALSAAVAFCFIGGLPAILAQAITAALMMAYALIGFAVLHTLTLGSKYRGLWLSCSYAILVISLGWLTVVIMALGLADAIFGFRRRYLQGRPPPLPAS